LPNHFTAYNREAADEPRFNRLTNLTWKYNGNQRGDFTCKLGQARNRTNLADNVNGLSRTFSWQYDPLYRLIDEVVTGANPTGSLGYVYDDVGNRTSRTDRSARWSMRDWPPLLTTSRRPTSRTTTETPSPTPSISFTFTILKTDWWILTRAGSPSFTTGTGTGWRK